MKNTLELLDKIANTVFYREENNLAYIDEDDESSYYIEHTIDEICEEELNELKGQLKIWEEIKKVASMSKVELNDLIQYIFMKIPLTPLTKKIFEKDTKENKDE